MSITDYLPRLGLLERTTPRHRAVDEVGRLRHQLAGAEIYMAGQRVQIEDLEIERDNATERRDIAEKALTQAEAVIRLRDQRIAELERRLNVGVLAEAVVAKTQELDCRSLQERFETGPVRRLGASPLAATDPAHVPAWVRIEGRIS
ncbi:hypothetical protein ABT186_01655 [Streptomyces sp. NPDC001634]|uniref:hypothetical protein n=1 Tax=Streptomyces sp. NPDC001634 TaxID=3154390 RepID=UPI00332FC608